VTCSSPVIIVGIYLLSKHGEEDDDDLSCDGESSATGESHHHLSQRGALTSGHFGALMPLSPQHHAHPHGHKGFDKDESTPLRSDRHRKGGAIGNSNGNSNGVTTSVVIIRDRQDDMPKNRRGSM
jgi:hypothetical protein